MKNTNTTNNVSIPTEYMRALAQSCGEQQKALAFALNLLNEEVRRAAAGDLGAEVDLVLALEREQRPGLRAFRGDV